MNWHFLWHPMLNEDTTRQDTWGNGFLCQSLLSYPKEQKKQHKYPKSLCYETITVALLLLAFFSLVKLKGISSKQRVVTNLYFPSERFKKKIIIKETET